MKARFLTFSAILLMSTMALQAQVDLGLLGGVNFYNMNGKDGDGDKYANGLLIGFHAGVNANIPVAPQFYFQPGLLFSVKGSKNDLGIIPVKASGDFPTVTKLSYIEMPLNLLYRAQLGEGYILLGFGPYVAYGIGGKENTEYGSTTFEKTVEFKSEIVVSDNLLTTAFYKRFDAGANIHFGYETSMGIFLQLNAQLGLLDIRPEYYWDDADSKAVIRNTGFGLSAGYRF
jgi:hypothetical protein